MQSYAPGYATCRSGFAGEKENVKLHLLFAGLLVAAPMTARASDLPMPGGETVAVGEPGWSIAFAPYGWAAGIDGNVASFGLPAASIDASFSDILDHLDFGAMVVGEVRYDQYGLFTDFAYVRISGSTGTPRGVIASNISLDAETVMFTAAPQVRVLQNERASVDLMAGLRVWSVDTRLSLSGGLLDGRSASDGDTWVDPLIGAKGRFNLTQNLFVSGWGMVGGFGAASDVMWDVWGGLGYEFTDRVSAVAGYRATGVDYSNDGFLYDVVQQGPVLGAVFRF